MNRPIINVQARKALPLLVFATSGLYLVRMALGSHSSGADLEHVAVASERPPATRSIQQIVRDSIHDIDPDILFTYNVARAAKLKARLDEESATADPDSRLRTTIEYAGELLNGGKTRDAIAAYANARKMMETDAPTEWKRVGSEFLTRQAIGYLRLGEEQNCCAVNNARSCLIPIRGAGIHTKQEGSRAAIRLLLQALDLKPGNMAARWLLNIAYMTVGEFPAAVPPRWLIRIDEMGGNVPFPKFYNAAHDLGLDMLGYAGSVIVEDFDGNGLLDILISSFRLEGPLRYFRNNGDGTFTERTKEAGLEGVIGGTNLTTTDYNNDGRPDFVVVRGATYNKNGNLPLSLFRNDGHGHFTDVTLEAGLYATGPSSGAVALDYNGDGWLDLFVSYESNSGNPKPCKLFRNNGNGTFTDVTSLCGLSYCRPVKGVATADFMRTGRPGIYLSCFHHRNVLLRNDGPAEPGGSPMGPWKFTDVTVHAGVAKQSSSFACFFFDYDNDGWPDLYVSGYGRAHSKEDTDRDLDQQWYGVVDLSPGGRNARHQDDYGLMSHGVDEMNVGDVVNDYLGLPSDCERPKLYRNNHDGTFTDTTKQVGLDRVIWGMGLNYGDLDNDGWIDFFAGTGDADLGTLLPKRVFRNHGGRCFDEVSMSGDFGHLQKGHGIAIADFDNSGQQGVYMVTGGAFEGDVAHSCLWVNPGNSNHWVTLKLEGVRSNRVGLGAEICVTVATPRGERNIYRTVSTGGSFGSSPIRQCIGLGDATAISKVRIDWPGSNTKQVVPGMAMDRFYTIREGEPNAVEWSVPRFKLPHGPNLHSLARR